jgi:hypothetical protein
MTATLPADTDAAVEDRTQLYVGGAWVASAGFGRIAVLNPATEDVIAQVAEGTSADVDQAVAAARAAFPAWSATAPAERADYLQKAHEASSPVPTSWPPCCPGTWACRSASPRSSRSASRRSTSRTSPS